MSILSRYIYKKLLLTTLFIVSLLLVINYIPLILSQLKDIADNDMPHSALLTLSIMYFPILLQFLLPISLFIAILLVYSRIAASHELTAMAATGISNFFHIAILYKIALPLTIYLAISFAVVAPWCKQHIQEASAHADIVSMLSAKEFTYIGNDYVIYVEEVDSNNKQVTDVFLLYNTTINNEPTKIIIKAQSAQLMSTNNGDMLGFYHGNMYKKSPNTGYNITSFDKYLLGIPSLKQNTDIFSSEEIAYIWDLPNIDTLEAHMELHWRIALVCFLPVIALLAFSFINSSPRSNSNVVRLMVAVICYFLYLGLLKYTNNLGKYGAVYLSSMWLVHILIFSIAISLLWRSKLVQWVQPLLLRS